MSGQHTPGRLRIGTPPPNGEQTIGTNEGLMVAVATTGAGVPTEANARRLAACWNACEGVPTEVLEAGLVSEQLWVQLTAQRDDLRAALNASLDFTNVVLTATNRETLLAEWSKAKAIIGKVVAVSTITPAERQSIDDKLREEYRVGFDGPPAD